MPFELSANTESGAALVASAEALARDFASRAAQHDRDGSYPFESVDALRRARYFAAPIPESLGGLGVSCVHDLIVSSSRLAKGDAAVAIGVNMHLIVVANLVRRWSMAVAAGDQRRSEAFEHSLRDIVSKDVVIAAAISEAGQGLTRPLTVAERIASGWRIDGHKIFCTMSPAASVLYASVRYVEQHGGERYGYAEIPIDAPGVTVNNDWDALGMRASGSHSVSLNGVELPASAVRGGFAAGDSSAFMERNLANGLFHASASLGIAEKSQATATHALRARGVAAADARSRTLVAENEIELAAIRAALARAATLIDEHRARNPTTEGSHEEIAALFTEAQAAKAFVSETAVGIVDRALAMSGGAGYLNGHALARAYRDVRAGSFMHPLGANRAYELITQTALGLQPVLH